MDTEELYQRYLHIINNELSSYNVENIKVMVSDLELIIKRSPASDILHNVNCFVGGYIHSVIEYYESSVKYYQFLIDIGVNVDFSIEDLKFCALFHSIGYITDGKLSTYIVNSSEWHIRNQGRKYIHNDKVSFMLGRDRTLYLLNKYNIAISESVYLSILLHDWDSIDTNKIYINNYDLNLKIKYTLPQVLHMIIESTNIKLLQSNNLDYKQEEIAYDLTKAKTKIYNKNKKVRSKINLDLKFD